MTELKDGIVHLKIGLFPDVNVFITLYKNISTNPHILVQRLSSITVDTVTDTDTDTDSGIDASTLTNETHDHFAIMDASRIASIDHLAIAVNSALLRANNAIATASNSTNGNVNGTSTSPQMGQKRGRALDTIVCAGGSTNVGAVLKDFGFNESSIAAEEAKTTTETETQAVYNVVLIGIGTTLEQYIETMTNDQIALASSQSQRTPETIADMVAFFGRERSQTEVMQLIKMFKTTKEEVAMQGLEKAIINRVAAKFFI